MKVDVSLAPILSERGLPTLAQNEHLYLNPAQVALTVIFSEDALNRGNRTGRTSSWGLTNKTDKPGLTPWELDAVDLWHYVLWWLWVIQGVLWEGIFVKSQSGSWEEQPAALANRIAVALSDYEHFSMAERLQRQNHFTWSQRRRRRTVSLVG